ncbi:hypothetical protein D3C85_1644570 [compost metagenome]
MIFPSASILSGPVVFGVTLVFAEVTADPFSSSFEVTSPITTAEEPVGCVPKSSSLATKTLATITVEVAVLQFVGFAASSQIS